MQTGVITPDTYSSLLREFSQKRRQGVLEIHTGEEKRELFFINGRIAFVKEEGTAEVSAVSERFESVFPEKKIDSSGLENLGQLQERLSDSCGITAEMFSFVLKHYVLDKLYEIRFELGGYYTFRFEMPLECKELLPSITVGQLLLDLVALEAEKEDFNARIGSEEMLSIAGEYTGTPSEEERSILRELESQPLALSELRSRSGVSLFAFQEAVSGMLDKATIAVDALASEAKIASDDMFAFLEDSIDSQFSESGLDEDGAEPMLLEAAADGSAQESKELFARAGQLPGEELSEEEEEDFEGDFTLSEKIYVWNMRLAYASWVPTLAALVIIVMGLFSPFLLWENILLEFGEF